MVVVFGRERGDWGGFGFVLTGFDLGVDWAKDWARGSHGLLVCLGLIFGFGKITKGSVCIVN